MFLNQNSESDEKALDVEQNAIAHGWSPTWVQNPQAGVTL